RSLLRGHIEVNVQQAERYRGDCSEVKFLNIAFDRFYALDTMPIHSFVEPCLFVLPENTIQTRWLPASFDLVIRVFVHKTRKGVDSIVGTRADSRSIHEFIQKDGCCSTPDQRWF